MTAAKQTEQKTHQNEEHLSFVENTFSLLLKAQISRTPGKRIIIEIAEIVSRLLPNTLTAFISKLVISFPS